MSESTSAITQGNHAGRRLLLAEPVAQPEVIPITETDILSLTFPASATYVVLDLGRVRLGRLTAEVIGPPGAIVDIGWDERLFPGTQRPLPHPGSLHPQWNQTDSWVLDGTMRAISTIDARAGRYILIAVWGDGPVQIRNLRVVEERYPAEARGQFSSSNPRLDRIWQVGVDTLYVNMSDAYADPWRERGQWWGDAFVDDHVNQAAIGDTLLLRRGLWLMGEAIEGGRPEALAPNGAGNYMLDYGMLWVQSMHDYLRQTGDAQALQAIYPALIDFQAYLDTYADADTGLLDIPVAPWQESVYIDPGSNANRYGRATAVNAMYYGTLLDAADIAEELGDLARAQAWRQKAGQLKQQINANLYLPSERRYAASLLNGQVVSPSPHAQAWALAYDLVPASEITTVADALMALTPPDPLQRRVEIYGMYWVLEGLGRAGRISDALALIEAYYGRLLDLGATTWWEVFDANTRYPQALSHGWGSSPTWFLTTYVLGARRTGLDTWMVKPALSGVAQASGFLPVGIDTLQVTWSMPSCQAYSVHIVSPDGAHGVLIVPLPGASDVLMLNDQEVWRDGAPLASGVTLEGDGVHLMLDTGPYTLTAQRDCG